MKTGDIVVYIGGCDEHLTLHKQYTIKTVLMTMTYGRYSTYYDIINDEGLLRHYDESKFILVEKFRDIKISKILSE
jgi:hypothetical protein